MFKKLITASAFLISSSVCFAQTVNNAPLANLIGNAVNKARTWQEYRTNPNSDQNRTLSLAEAISSAANLAREHNPNQAAPRSVNSSCVTNMWVSNFGPYSSDRNCTTDYFNRAQMDSIIYPAFGVSLVARLPTIDVLRDGNTMIHLAFYSSTGMMSEYLVFGNQIP